MSNIEQFAKDLQALLQSATTAKVYERQAPRNTNGSISAVPPFVVYTCDTRAPADEAGEWTADLLLDVWTLNSWLECYQIAQQLDEALDATAYQTASGTICADRNGLVFQRMERDPDDERIRRIQGQYLLRHNSNQ